MCYINSNNPYKIPQSNTVKLLELKYGKSIYDLLFDMYCVQDKSYRTIAKELGISFVTVHKYIYALALPKKQIKLIQEEKGGNENV